MSTEKNTAELISIVVPVYNVEEYLPCCIESMQAQTYQNLEILLVDDGATDRSGEICDQYAAQDPRIRVIHKANGGQSDARNVGIRDSRGNWLVFVDSDDFVSPNYIENLYLLHQKTGADLTVTGAFKFFQEDTCRTETPDWQQIQVFHSAEAIENMLYRKGIPIYPIAKMYRRGLFDDILFPKGMLFEDLWIEYRLFDIAEKIAYHPIADYYYRQRSGSTINAPFNERNLVQLEIMEEMTAFIHQKYPAIDKSVVSKYFSINCNLYSNIPSEEKYAEKEKQIKSLIKQQRKIVLHDGNNKKLIRVIALSTYFPLGGFRAFSRVYRWMVQHELLHMKLPV